VNKLIFMLIAVLFFSIARGQSQHTTTTAKILLHAGPNEYSKTLGQVPANSAIDILGTDMSTGYAYVRTSTQQKGWIKMQHLQNMPASQSLKPATPAKANNKNSRQFGSWVQKQWRSVKTRTQKIIHPSQTLAKSTQTVTMAAKAPLKKKSLAQADHGWIFLIAILFCLLLLIGVLITRHNARKSRLIL
jgi:uncharacterized protein YgiM (DUF1202 family)